VKKIILKKSPIPRKGSAGVFSEIAELIKQSRKKVAAVINQEMVLLYWNIGKIIKEKIIRSDRAEYGKQILQSLSGELTLKYGKGFSPQNLWYMVQLYDTYPILHAVRGEFNDLSWTHIRTILPIKDDLKRKFYAVFCLKERWSTRVLKDRIKVAEYLTNLPSKEMFAEKLHKAVRAAQQKDELPVLIKRNKSVTFR
jgi:hypothetical protein